MPGKAVRRVAKGTGGSNGNLLRPVWLWLSGQAPDWWNHHIGLDPIS